MSAKIAAEAPQAPPTGAAGKNHAFCRRTSAMSAEIAAGDFSQFNYMTRFTESVRR
jgi:hypothetical protein